jgi:hypothetical protein
LPVDVVFAELRVSLIPPFRLNRRILGNEKIGRTYEQTRCEQLVERFALKVFFGSRLLRPLLLRLPVSDSFFLMSPKSGLRAAPSNARPNQAAANIL